MATVQVVDCKLKYLWKVVVGLWLKSVGIEKTNEYDLWESGR